MKPTRVSYDEGKKQKIAVQLKDVGGFGNGPHQFNDPRDVDAHLALSIYIADYNNNRVVRLDSRMYYLSDFKTSLDSPYYFEMPLSVAVDNQYDIFIQTV